MSFKKLVLLGGGAVLFLIALITAFNSIHVVEQGNVGLVIDRAGSGRGSITTRSPGLWMTIPWAQGFVEYPTIQRRQIWTAAADEGSQTNEEFTFRTSDNQTLTADVAVAYAVLPERAAEFYQTYRFDNVEQFATTHLRDYTRQTVENIMSQYTVMQVIGSDKPKIDAQIKQRLADTLRPLGIRLVNFGFPNNVRISQSLKEEIENKNRANQQAQTAQNKVATIRAEAEQKIALARGDSTARVMAAYAEAEANRVVSESINPTLIEWEKTKGWVKNWNGEYPGVMAGGGANFLYQIPGM